MELPKSWVVGHARPNFLECPGTHDTDSGCGCGERHCSRYRARLISVGYAAFHLQPLLQQLHWLPVRERIDYKLAVLTYKIHHTSTPVYLSRHIQPLIVTRRLRSSATPRVCKPTTRTNFADRAFRCSAPAVWNSLTVDIVDSSSLPIFKRKLKTFLFRHAFSSS